MKASSILVSFFICVCPTLGFAITPVPNAAPSPTPSPSPSRLLNISSRAAVGTGDRVEIAGFIIEGDAKDVLIRGLGPSLRANGSPFPGRLQDPTAELFSGQQTVMFNDDWKVTQRTQIEATGIPPASDLESAIVRNLAAGGYTAILRGKNQTTGIGLVEIFDLASTATSQLKNLSTRGFVGTGNNVLIGGFIIGGGGNGIRLVIRVLGPSLTDMGVTDALQNPALEVYNANGALIGANDNWEETQQFQLEQSKLAPTRPAEAALLTELSPGSFTVVASGVNGTSGTALLEVYNVPQPPPIGAPGN